MTKVYSRDKKGRFCSSSNPELKALSLFVNKDAKNIDAEKLVDILNNSFYKANVRFVEHILDIYKAEPNRKCKVDFKVNEPSIIFTVAWETV
jgi:hypothetical protein